MTDSNGPLRVLQLSVMEGANYYSGSPIVVLRLDLGEYDEVFTNAIEGFFSALKSHLPSLHEHHCSPGRPGGFFERVAEGTLLGHVAEHVAIELQTLAGMDVGFGKTRVTRVPGVYNVVYRFEDEATGMEAGRMAVDLVNAILMGGEFDVSGAVRRLRKMGKARRPDPFTRTILREAKQRRIPVQRMAASDLLILGTGARQKRIGAGLHSHSGALGLALAEDRERWMQLLSKAGIPVAPYAVVNSPVKAAEFQAWWKRPVRVRPVRCLDGSDLASPALLSDVSEISHAFQETAKDAGRAVIQAIPDGEWGNVFVVEGRALKVERFSGASGEEGAVASDPPSQSALSQLAVRAARWIGLDAATVNLIAPTDADSRPLVLDIHPAEGSLSRLGEEIAPEAARLAMERLFPEGTSSRIRLIGITGSRGASRLAERLVRFFDASGERAGWMDADDGVHFPAWGDLGIPHSPYPIRPSPLRGELGKGDAENPPKPDLQRLLREPDLETAVVAVPPGRILQKGLPYDCAEVGVVLNVGDMPDEFDYLHNIDDFAHALCVVPEKVVDTGLAVLNADDPRVLKMADRAKGRVMLFSADYHNQAMRVHADRNGAAVVLDGDEIVVLRGRERIRLIEEVGTALGLDQPVNGQFDVLDPERREVLLAFLAVVWGLGLLGEKSGGVDVSAFLG